MSLDLISGWHVLIKVLESTAQFVWRIVKDCCECQKGPANTQGVAIARDMKKKQRRQFTFDMLARVIGYTDIETSKNLRLSCKSMNRFFKLYRIKEGISPDDSNVLIVDSMYVKFGAPDEKVFIAVRRTDSYDYETVLVEKVELYNYIWYIFSEDVKLDFVELADFLKFNRMYFQSFTRDTETVLTIPLSINSPNIQTILMELVRPRNSLHAQRFHIVFGRTRFKSMFLSDNGNISYFGNLTDVTIPASRNGNNVLAYFQSNEEFFKDFIDAITNNFDESAVLLFDRTEFNEVHDLFVKVGRHRQLYKAGCLLLEEFGFLLRFHAIMTEGRKLIIFGSLKQLTDFEIERLMARRLMAQLAEARELGDSSDEDFTDDSDDDLEDESDDESIPDDDDIPDLDLPVEM